MVGKSSFLLASNLSLVVSEFSVSRMLASTSWRVDSVSRVLTSCSSALDVYGRVSHELSRGEFLAASAIFLLSACHFCTLLS